MQRLNLAPLRRKLLILVAAIAIFVVIAIAVGVALLFSPLLTRYVEGDAFLIAMEHSFSSRRSNDFFRALISGFSCFQHTNAFVDEGQTDRQSKAFALAALDGELATVLAHDATYDK